MTIVLTIAVAAFIAVIQASFLPWVPFLRTFAPIGAGVVSLLIIGRVQRATVYAIIASIVVGYLTGTSSLRAPLVFTAAILATIPILQLIRSGHTTIAVAVFAIIFAITDRGTLAPTTLTLMTIVWAACWNAVFAVGVLAFTRRRASFRIFR